MGVEHGGRDDAGRGRGHESLRERALVHAQRALEGIAFLSQLRLAVIGDLSLRLGRVPQPRPAQVVIRHPLPPDGEVFHIQGDGAIRGAAIAVHAPRHIGRKRDARHLAVIGNIDAGFGLRCNHGVRGLVNRSLESGGIRPAALILLQQHLGQHRPARQATHMRDQESLIASLHRTPLPCLPLL